MTVEVNRLAEDGKRKKARSGLLSLLFLAGMLYFGACLSEEAAGYVTYGLKLAIEKVIPTAFPFMILTEAYTAYGSPENIKPLSFLFSRLFGIGKAGLRPFICGNVAGFPLGVRITSSLYKDGSLTKAEAERLLALSSNPSLPFMIGAVGGGMFGSIKIGVVLALSVYLSTIVCGTVFKKGNSCSTVYIECSAKKFNPVESVSAAGQSCVGICSFITLFSVISGLVSKRIKEPILVAITSSILEVTGGVYSSSLIFPFSPRQSILIAAFALGFGGISVLMQSAYLKSDTDLSMKKYFIMKLSQGVTSALLCSAFCLFQGF